MLLLMIALGIVIGVSNAILIYQYATKMLAPRDPLDPELPDTWHGFWPKGPRHE